MAGMERLMSPDLQILSDRFTLVGPKQTLWTQHEHFGGTHDIVCKTLYTAISTGTELAAFNGVASLSGGNIYPRVNGYMNVSKILHTGKKVKKYRADDIVLTFNCHETHFIVNENEVLVKIGNTVLLDRAVFAYAYHLGYSSLLKSGFSIGAKVAVIGQGLLGQAAAELLSRSGYAVTVVSSHGQPDKSLEQALGINRIDRAADLCEQFDLIILTTGKWDDYFLSLEKLTNNGVLSILGFPGRDGSLPKLNPFRAKDFYQKQLSIQACGFVPKFQDSRGFNRFNERSNLEYIVKRINDESLNPTRFASMTSDYTDLEFVYRRLEERLSNEISALISW
jgi:2-desacetyl-2-hydroxyethyl bacteriochlorophyllide A dehydrogenase